MSSSSLSAVVGQRASVCKQIASSNEADDVAMDKRLVVVQPETAEHWQ